MISFEGLTAMRLFLLKSGFERMNTSLDEAQVKHVF